MLDELLEWFNNYFDSCYYVKHDDFPESLFMFYDINYVRQLKLAKLDNNELIKKEITGVCLFEQDWKNDWFICDSEYIWLHLKNNYNFNYNDFKIFIKIILAIYSESNKLTPINNVKYIYNYKRKYKYYTHDIIDFTKAHVLYYTDSEYNVLKEYKRLKPRSMKFNK